MMYRNVVISVGPIPARLDSVKFITNRFKGGLAVKTAKFLASAGHKVTVVTWKHTELPPDLTTMKNIAKIVQVNDVFEYYNWFVANAKSYDTFVMAAAVANLTPVNPFEGKFPSHNYKPGDEFDIKFMIAPRAIDAIKAINPRACLIGYKLFDANTDKELIEIARHTQADSKANIIFANTPETAKTRKIAITADGAAIPCTFNGHLELMNRVISADYYQTKIDPLTSRDLSDPDVRTALATVKIFEQTFNHFGTVAVPVKNHKNWFATTARGHTGEPVIVYGVDNSKLIVHASGKATLNAPSLNAMLDMHPDKNTIIVHRHEDDPNYRIPENAEMHVLKNYQFPGTVQETVDIYGQPDPQNTGRTYVIQIPYHGSLMALPIRDVDWDEYHKQFPKKYFSTPTGMEIFIENQQAKSEESLEVGCNTTSTAKYAYDKYVIAENALNLTWQQIQNRRFSLIYIRNALNYLSLEEIAILVTHCDKFIANTFIQAPHEKLDTNEASVTFTNAVTSEKTVRHILRLPDDSIVTHEFHAYTATDFSNLGLDICKYGKNSILVSKGLEPGDVKLYEGE